MRVKYRRTYVNVDAKKKTRCECCNKKPKPKGLHTHHWRYEFTTKEVKEKPELALKNTNVLCFRCHRVANALRIIVENSEIAKKLMRMM